MLLTALAYATQIALQASARPTTTGIVAAAPTATPSRQTGKLPALGWNTWNAYGCDINEAKVLAAANSFVSLGLKDAGYQYVNIDVSITSCISRHALNFKHQDCWAKKSRDVNGKLVPDSTKFPNGLASVASKIHALGLKIGIYSDAGTNTCAGYPGSLGYEATDAATWSSWGIDCK